MYPAAIWRLLETAPTDGATNMAIDEAVLLSVQAGKSPPTLRFFAWDPACLSLGYAQSIADADRTRMATLGYGIVRRATGGRAILHTDELTYSVCAPLSEPRLRGGIVESYRRLSAGLLAGLEQLGMHVRNDQGAPAAQLDGPVCFEMPSNYEITANDKKLIGSAQVRKRGVALQHGTLPLEGDIARICDALAFPNEAAREEVRSRVRSRATTLTEALGRPIHWEAVAHALTEGFARVLNISFERRELTIEEEQEVERLRTEKYGNEAWTARVPGQKFVG